VRTFVVVIDTTNDTAIITGSGARELLLEAGSRRPFWSHQRGAWMTSAKVAKDLLALAELRHIDCDVQETGLR
jgi:hypothetical protein